MPRQRARADDRPTDDDFQQQIDDLNELETIETQRRPLAPDDPEHRRLSERELAIRRRVDAWHRRFL